jgi:DNA repair exonuclease SbcCD nuclease subunit
MEFIFTADWHLSGYLQDRIVKESNLPERLDSIKRVMYQIADFAIKNKIKYIVVGGDSLHNKSIIYTDAQSVLLDYFRNYKELIFYIIDGNHDFGSRGENPNSALKSVDSESNVIRIVSPQKIFNETVLLVPYSSTMISEIKNNSCKYLISHFGLNEAQLNSGISLVADLGIKDLKNKYKYVLLGHYHSPQDLSSDGIEIKYVGSPIQRDWGEKNEEKRFLVVDTEKDTIKSIPTTGYKKHFEFQITSENKEEILKVVTELKDEGHEIKLIKSEVFDTDDLPGDFRIIEKIDKDITNRGINSLMSMDEKIAKYLQIKDISEDQIEGYKKVGIEIVTAVGG